MVRILYFDLDGTIVYETFGRAKSALAGGRLEALIKEAGFERQVFVGNAVSIMRGLTELGKDVDGIKMAFDLCAGAFQDAARFREVTTLVPDPEHRARHIDQGLDWWYMDNLARSYWERDLDMSDYEKFRRTRILEPEPDGDGSDVVAWMELISSS